MTDTPAPSEPATAPVTTSEPTHRPVESSPPPRRQQSRLTQAAALVGIVAGIVFIVAVVFGTGFMLGAHSGGHRGGGHHGGGHDRPGMMMFHRGGPPPMAPADRMSPPFGPGGQFGPQGPGSMERPTTAPARP